MYNNGNILFIYNWIHTSICTRARHRKFRLFDHKQITFFLGKKSTKVESHIHTKYIHYIYICRINRATPIYLFYFVPFVQIWEIHVCLFLLNWFHSQKKIISTWVRIHNPCVYIIKFGQMFKIYTVHLRWGN